MRVTCWESISDVKHTNYPNGMIENHDYSRNTIHYIMKLDGAIIGGARLKKCYNIYEVPDYEIYLKRDLKFVFPIAHLGKLIVLPKYQGIGLSKLFDKKRYTKSKELGCKMILGWTHINSKRLLHKLSSDNFKSAGYINIENFTGIWELGNGEIIYKLI